MPELIDIHTHWCQFGRDLEDAPAQFEWLEQRGYTAVAAFPLPGMGATREKMVDLIPGIYRDRVALTLERAATDDLDAWREFHSRWKEQPHTLELLSFLDVRAWDGKEDLGRWWGAGHTGLKNILIDEADEAKMAMPPLRHIQGLSPETYRDAHRAVFAAAAEYGVPLVYHVDLSFHLEFVTECLQAHPGLSVDIPHFGFSRRAVAQLFDRFPSVVTDISSLGPQMAANPASYRTFILDHPDRVLLGSDVLSSRELRAAWEYMGMVRGLGLPEDAEAAVLGGNARRFLAGE